MFHPLVLSLLIPSALGVTFPRQPRLHGLTSDAATFADQTYDYVIIGGGTAGLVLAARLTEFSNVTVGVIEAGTLRLGDAVVDTPAFIGQGLFNTDYDWNFVTVPQAHVSQRNIPINRGKMLGGSAGLNFMIWQRGSKQDYDAWSQLGIGSGWNWDGLLPYFLKTETVHAGPGRIGTSSEFDGQSGPLPIQYNNFYSPLEAPYAQTLESLGVTFNPDPEAGDSTGLFNCAASVDPATGNRSYSAVNYFLTNQDRNNLVVLEGAQATKINLTPGIPIVATGAEFVVNNITYSVNATKEVILSAGSIQSPQLLELSGIGNPAILEKYGISVIHANVDVGENLQDHTHITSQFELNDPTIPTTSLLNVNATFEAEEQQLYHTNHTGVYTYTASDVSFHTLQTFWSPVEFAQALTTLRNEIQAANLSEWQSKQAQIQLTDLESASVGQMELLFFAGDVTVTNSSKFVDILNFGSKHFSRGSVHIGSSDPLISPLIDPNYFQYSIDKEVVVKGAQIARKLVQTAPLSGFIKGPTNPGPDVTSEADFETFVLQNIGTEWHPIGTASLGPEGAGGVVNENLVVYGTSNLRVVDASVIPLEIAAHIQATVYAIAEKAADIIKSGN
ncbi:hypothetical protein D9757_009134 [Collybiopsis confluens]|uniref:Glucose-methanol-choline oxidoreductase N-terminal domain-containing protein n=1 Tax=Collybiopsis confluens TaxID=2823264 RepID=A0A8H5H794_9AGAR|nr:hypothetical protein D9757_009134 [Collybiopsis confluens]